MNNTLMAFLLLLFVGNTALSQEVNKMDGSGKRHGLWKGTYENSNRPRYEGTFNHGKETGTFTFFEDDKSSTLVAKRIFAEDGSCYTTFFDAKGKKLSEGKEVNRLKEGDWKFYNEGTQTLLSIEPYSKGKINGIKKVYFPSGAIAEEVSFVDGIKQGKYKQFTEKGIVLEESTYKNDILDGPVTFRDAHGDVVSKGQFAANKKSGVWQFYEKGKKVKEEDLTNKKVQLARKERRN